MDGDRNNRAVWPITVCFWAKWSRCVRISATQIEPMWFENELPLTINSRSYHYHQHRNVNNNNVNPLKYTDLPTDDSIKYPKITVEIPK